MTETHDRRELLGDLLRGAIPVNPSPIYVTREEFDAKLGHLETKIEREGLRTKMWVLSGVVAIIMSFGGGYVSIISKIDRIAETLPTMTRIQDGRRDWIQIQDRRDLRQDETLRELQPEYEPIPYGPSPQ